MIKVITIGRSNEGNDVIIDDPWVSRHHFQIVQDDDGSFRLADFGSTNGTYINGQRVSGEVELDENDIVRVGNTIIPWKQYFYSSFGGFPETEQPFSAPPQTPVQQPNDIKPDSYLGLAIVAALFNLIFGIVAIIYAVRVNKLWEKGDKERAEKASESAKGCSIAGLILGVIGIIRIVIRIM